VSFLETETARFDCREARNRLLIPSIWKLLGLPGEPGKICSSPFREDSRPSFSVSQDGKLWNDFGTGAGGDAVDFLAAARGLTKSEAAREFIELAKGSFSLPAPALVTRGKTLRVKKPAPELPELHELEIRDAIRFAELRRWPMFVGMEIARARGLLGIALLRDGEGVPFRCLAIRDASGRVMACRKIDGSPFRFRWEPKEKEWKPAAPYKTKTLGEAAWPVGAANLRKGKPVLICEGLPDFVAAFALGFAAEIDCDFVAVLGAGQRIHAEALNLFAGKRIRIFQQADEAGEAAAVRWTKELREAGAGTVDAVEIISANARDVSEFFAALLEPEDLTTAAEALFAGLTEGGVH
jgi:hypothetical protein